MVGPSPSGSELDGLLAVAGYWVRTSEFRHVARSLDSAMLIGSGSTPSSACEFAGGGSVPHHNPPTLSYDTWVTPAQHQPPPRHIPAAVLSEEEGSGISLVHLLMSCADAVHRGDTVLAATLLEEEIKTILTRVNTAFGIGKVVCCFADALAHRLYSPASTSSISEDEILYHHFYDACPYLKFAHFTANQAILEAFDGHDHVHVIDFGLKEGLQWPPLIQALALRPGGPPSLRLTGIGPPSTDGRDYLREVGIRLAELARSLHVRFAFRGIMACRLDDVRPWMLQLEEGEAVAFNSVLQLHRLLSDPDSGHSPADQVLAWIAALKPNIVTLVEQEADHNKPLFLDRFTESLFYYSTVFDSLEAGRRGNFQQQTSAAFAQVYLQKEICNVVCCEGPGRVERHEPLCKWRTRMVRAGLSPVRLGSNAFKQASMLLTLFSGEGYCVREVDGCLTLGWHTRPLISASAWTVGDVDVELKVEVPVSNVTVNSNNNDHMNHGSDKICNNASVSTSSSSNI